MEPPKNPTDSQQNTPILPSLAYSKGLQDVGAIPTSLCAYIAGGARMFDHKKQPSDEGIGVNNIAAVKKALVKARIPLVEEHTGGNEGRQTYDTLSNTFL